MSVHGVMSWGWLSPRGKVLARAGLGVLGWVIPGELVDEAVGDGLAWEMRLRSLPARVGVYFVLGLCLFSDLPYGQVMAKLVAGLDKPLRAAGWRVPSATSLTGVRRRIGEVPLRSLLQRLCPGLLSGVAGDRRAQICGLDTAAWDGTVLDCADTGANTAAFGKPGTRRRGWRGQPGVRGQGPFPQLRVVALIACGTRLLLDAAAGPVAGKGAGERALAAQLLGSLRAGMLLLADRGFYSWQLWRDAAATGAHLLWRVKANTTLIPAGELLPDRSWLAIIPDPAAVRQRTVRNAARRRRGSTLAPDTAAVPGITVRVIEFTITTSTGKTRTEPYRLITTLLDWRRYPALDLARGYASRWAIETAYRDLKTTLRGTGRVLRGKTPVLARQELWAYLCIYQAIRLIIARAAAGTGLDPARLSFTTALRAIRDTTTTRTRIRTALTQVSDQITTNPLPERPGRVRIRAVKRTTSPYQALRTAASRLPHRATTAITITTHAKPAPPTPTPATQPQHHPATTKPPP